MDSRPTPSSLSYQDFDPDFEWSREEGSYTLRIHLPGFKKENLRVEVGDDRNLIASGERQLDSTRRSRFSKTFKIPEDCNVDEVYAKFEKEVLYVIQPNVKTTRLADHSQDRPSLVAQTAPTEPQQETTPQPVAEQQHGMNRKVGEGVSGETATKQEEGKSSELVDTAQWDAGKIVEKEKDRIAVPAGNGKLAGDVMGDEGTDKGFKQVYERRMEPETKPSEGAGAGGQTETVRYDYGGPVVGPTKPIQPLWNVAAAILVLACLAMYVAYKLGKATG